jgi:hypothetical protein
LDVHVKLSRVAMHGVRVLLEAQAAAPGLPPHVVELPWPRCRAALAPSSSCPGPVVELPWPRPNPVYEQLMYEAMDAARQHDVSQVIFGDLSLADIRAYREISLLGTGMTPVFPIATENLTGERPGSPICPVSRVGVILLDN